MRCILHVGLAALALVVAGAPARALYLDGGKLQGQCAAMSRDGSYRVADGLVGGYVAGVVDATLARAAGARAKPAFCLPAGADLKRVRDAVCRYAGQHGEQRRATAATLVRLALAESFPCPR